MMLLGTSLGDMWTALNSAFRSLPSREQLPVRSIKEQVKAMVSPPPEQLSAPASEPQVELSQVQARPQGSVFPRIIGGEQTWHLPPMDDILEGASEQELSQSEIRDRVRIIEETSFESQCIVTSLSHRALDEVERLNPRLARGYIVYQTIGSIERINTGSVMLKSDLATPLAIMDAHDVGKEIHVWTVNDPTRMSFMIDRGVDGILTDYPETLVEVLEQRAELNDLERLVLRFGEFVSR